MAEVRVQLPLGALVRRVEFQGVGKSGIPRASGARDRGSNPAVLTGRSALTIAVGPVLVRVGGC